MAHTSTLQDKCTLKIINRELMLDEGANLKLFKTFIHSFMKFSPHGAEIHRLLDDFIILLNLISSDSINTMNKKAQHS